MFARQQLEMKGCQDFVKIASVVKSKPDPCRFVAAGGAKAAHGIDQTGWVPQQKMPELYAQASVVVVPSIWDEPFGLVLIEAMASGRAVVAYKSGAIPEIVVDGTTGFLVERGNVDAMSERVLYLLRNPEVSSRMGEAGRKRAIDHFDIKKCAQAYKDNLVEAASRG